MEQSDLQEVMKFHLSNFNDEETKITDDTVHSEILSMTDGFEGDHSATVYPKLVKWTMHNNGGPVKDWPADWLSRTVKDLAAVLVCLLIMLVPAIAQKPLTVTLGAGKTELRQNAIMLAVSYLPSIGFTGKEKIAYGKTSLFSVTPNLVIQSGTQDAFSSITAKITGLAMFFKTTKVGKIITPDTRKVVHTVPVSVGIESNNRFNFINGLVEAGYVPWYQSATNPLWIRRTKVGVFIQGGWKWKVDSTGSLATGGQIDESDEALNSGILRVKGSVGVDTKPIFTVQALKIGLVGNADVWFDLLNSATYYRIQGAARIYLTPDNFFDLQYARGSGAPNFNQGDSYGIGLTVSF